MDFAKPLVKKNNVTTKSNICMLPVPPLVGKEEEAKDDIDRLLVQAANRAATDLIISNSPSSSVSDNNKDKSQKELISLDPNIEKLVNLKHYPTRLLQSSQKILPSSLVVIFESFDSLDFVYASPGAIFHNRNGHFHHDDFIGKPFGSKIRSRNNQGLGFVHLLKPTPELWARSLNHRTQIVHELDASIVIFNLDLQPNMIVCESGTGSGAMSHAILRTIAPYGKLHTYEFNQMRVLEARKEFERNGVNHLVKVHWRDVCGKDKKLEKCNEETDSDAKDKSAGNAEEVDKGLHEKEGEQLSAEKIGSGGFNIGPAAAHAIFLDLPEPWLAIPHAAHTIKQNGRLCSYSPCVEQSQRTIEKLKAFGFHSIKTLEVRLREHYVDDVTMECVPTEKLSRELNPNPYVPGAVQSLPVSSNSGKEDEKVARIVEKGEKAEVIEPESSNDKSNNLKTKSSNGSSARLNLTPKKRKILCARPFATMRGHTAFLTFATAGNASHPDPNL